MVGVIDSQESYQHGILYVIALEVIDRIGICHYSYLKSQGDSSSELDEILTCKG